MFQVHLALVVEQMMVAAAEAEAARRHTCVEENLLPELAAAVAEQAESQTWQATMGSLLELEFMAVVVAAAEAEAAYLTLALAALAALVLRDPRA